MDVNDVEKIVKKWVKERFGNADVRFLKVEKSSLSGNWDVDLDVIIKHILSEEVKKFVVEVSEQEKIISYKKRIF